MVHAGPEGISRHRGATLKIEKELDERGWAKVWYTPNGSGGEEGSEIHIDDLTGDRIKRLILNRVKAKLDTDRDEGEGWDDIVSGVSKRVNGGMSMSEHLKELHNRIQKKNG